MSNKLKICPVSLDRDLTEDWSYLILWFRGYKTVFMLNPTEHGILLFIKSKMMKKNDFSSVQALRCCINHANKC